MRTRVIVCGGRDFSDKKLCFESLDRILTEYDDVEIVSGHARGADLLGEEYAAKKGLACRVFPADWNKWGKAAGPIRNREMLIYAEAEVPVIVAFWDGRSLGTKNMIKQAENAGAEVHIVRY